MEYEGTEENEKPEVPISWFPVPGGFELPENLQGLFSKAREPLGFVPNAFRVYGFRPERLSTWSNHFRMLHEETENLSAAEREMTRENSRGNRIRWVWGTGSR